MSRLKLLYSFIKYLSSTTRNRVRFHENRQTCTTEAPAAHPDEIGHLLAEWCVFHPTLPACIRGRRWWFGLQLEYKEFLTYQKIRSQRVISTYRLYWVVEKPYGHNQRL